MLPKPLADRPLIDPHPTRLDRGRADADAILERHARAMAAGDGGYLDQIGPRLGTAFLERGLLLRPLGNVVYFMPPYVITDAEAEWALEHIREVLASL